MDGVGPLDPFLVCGVAGFAREVVGVLAVHVDVAACSRADGCKRSGVGLDEEALSDDLVGLGGRGWSPLIGNTPNDVLQPFECFEAVCAADFLGIACNNLVGVLTRF